ncbi:MAG: hypothetical protein H6Q71_1053 [Firmicutes bacterium]|nr:hypothetical protein [Bacillota bacterium]
MPNISANLILIAVVAMKYKLIHKAFHSIQDYK